jgi:phosphatidylglycerol:prolipoprotein diacylglycerol transferase
MYFPVLFKLGPLNLYTYGLAVVLAFLVAGLFVFWQAKKRKLDPMRLLNFSPYLIIGIMVGARVYYIFQHFDYYQRHLIEIFYFWQGGLSMYGGVIAAFLLLLVFLRKESKEKRWVWLDLLGLGLLFGSAIGRIGCFLNGCCFGEECHLPWGIVNGFLGDGITRHPTQLYESLGYLIAFGIGFFFYSKQQFGKLPGNIFFFSLVLHSLVRFGVEFFRFSDSFIGPFKTAQVVTLAIIVVAIIIFSITKQTRIKLKGVSK